MAKCDNNVAFSLAKRKIQAYKLCQEYLGGSWKSVTFDEFNIQVLSGGLSNELFVCSLPDNYPISKLENRKVLLRIYGRLYGELSHDIHALVSDVVVFALLSERKVGPQLYSIFPEGRLEQLLPGKQLSLEESREPHNSMKIARKLKQFHEMTLPLCREPKWVWELMDKLLEDIDRILEENDNCGVIQEICKKYDLHKETVELRQYIESNPSPVVFCHNDVQEGNILVIPQGKDNDGKEQTYLQFIDFEYSAYNYRAHDFANHFCEWMFDYTNKEPPYFTATLDNFPTKEQQLIFIREYLGKSKNSYSVNIEEQETLEDVSRFVMLSHLLWALWSIVQSKMSTIEFGYLEYAVTRLECYFKQKRDLGLS